MGDAPALEPSVSTGDALALEQDTSTGDCRWRDSILLRDHSQAAAAAWESGEAAVPARLFSSCRRQLFHRAWSSCSSTLVDAID